MMKYTILIPIIFIQTIMVGMAQHEPRPANIAPT